MGRRGCHRRAVAVKAARDNQAEIAVLPNPSVHLWVAVRQGALYQDRCVVAERRLRLGRSLSQRAESLKFLSPLPIVGVDTGRWGSASGLPYRLLPVLLVH